MKLLELCFYVTNMTTLLTSTLLVDSWSHQECLSIADLNIMSNSVFILDQMINLVGLSAYALKLWFVTLVEDLGMIINDKALYGLLDGLLCTMWIYNVSLLELHLFILLQALLYTLISLSKLDRDRTVSHHVENGDWGCVSHVAWTYYEQGNTWTRPFPQGPSIM